MRRALALRADLHDTPVLAGGVEHGVALAHVPADRFLAIHVGAGLHRGDRVQRVPMVRRTDQHNVEVLLLEHLAVVRVGSWLFLRFLPLAGDLHRAREHLLVHVANRDDLDRRDLDQPPKVALSIPPGADQTDPSGLAADNARGISAKRWQRRERGGGGRGLEKSPPADVKARAGPWSGSIGFHGGSMNRPARPAQPRRAGSSPITFRRFTIH